MPETILPSAPPNNGVSSKPPEPKTEGGGNDETNGMDSSTSASPADAQEHEGRWQKASKRACAYFDNVAWFFGDPNRALAVLTALLVIIGIAALVIQTDTEHRQLRAYVGESPEGSFLNTNGIALNGVNIKMANTGLTPAFNFRAGIEVRPLPYPSGAKEIIEKTILDIKNQDKVIFPQGFVYVAGIPDKKYFTKAAIDYFSSKNERIYVFGVVRYVDAFGNHHFTHFCSSFSTATPMEIFRTGEGPQGGAGSEACVFWNDAD